MKEFYFADGRVTFVDSNTLRDCDIDDIPKLYPYLKDLDVKIEEVKWTDQGNCIFRCFGPDIDKAKELIIQNEVGGDANICDENGVNPYGEQC